MVPGFGIIVNILKDNLKMHFFKLSLLKPRNQVRNMFLKQKFR